MNQEDNKKLKLEIEKLKKKCEEYLEGWKRERAGFINYKKDEMERIKGIVEYSNEEIILKILPILDNFNVAEKSIPQNVKKDGHVKGLLQIKSQITEFLNSYGLEEIQTKKGDSFDPNIHEAVEKSESGQYQPDTIIEEIKKGYKLNEKLLRPVKVKVSKD